MNNSEDFLFQDQFLIWFQQLSIILKFKKFIKRNLKKIWIFAF